MLLLRTQIEFDIVDFNSDFNPLPLLIWIIWRIIGLFKRMRWVLIEIRISSELDLDTLDSKLDNPILNIKSDRDWSITKLNFLDSTCSLNSIIVDLFPPQIPLNSISPLKFEFKSDRIHPRWFEFELNLNSLFVLELERMTNRVLMLNRNRN